MDWSSRREDAHGLSGRSERRREGARAGRQPPMTPMIDVVFQLLLFFLLGCRFISAEGHVQANLPDGGCGIAEPLRIVLRSTGVDNAGVRVESSDLQLTAASLPAMHDRLKGLLQRPGMAKRPVRFEPAGPVRWQHVVDAFNEARRAGCRSVSLRGPRRGT